MLISTLLIFGFLGILEAKKDDSNMMSTDDNEEKCFDVKCTMGEYCVKGKCLCYDSCPSDWMNHQTKICVDGYTYAHACDLYRNMCYCRENDPRCGDKRYFQGHRASPTSIIRYFTECRDLTLVCYWSSAKRYFKYQLIMWMRELLTPQNQGRDSTNVLLRYRDPYERIVVDSLISKGIGRRGERAGPLISFLFCELDVDKSGMIEENELSALTQIALPTLACLEIFFGNCISTRIISRDNWLACFEIDPKDSMQCSSFV